MNLYFDYAATTPMKKEVLDEYVSSAISYPFNPSAVHEGGKMAKEKLEEERTRIAGLLDVDDDEIIFTSGGSEALSIVFDSLIWQKRPGAVVFGRLEHEAVSSYQSLLKELGWEIRYIKAERDGHYDIDKLSAIIDKSVRLVAIQSVNNVLGLISNTSEIAELIRKKEEEGKRKIIFLSDSVQAIGKLSFPLHSSGVDAASFSAHKIGGPRGTGFLYLKKGVSIRALAGQGGQEMNLRGGTENLMAISAMRKALEISLSDRTGKEEKVKKLNMRLRDGLARLGLKLLSPENASPFILSFSSPLPSEVTVRILSVKGIYVSAGSACSNNKKGEAVEILRSYGVKENDAIKAIRVSLSEEHDAEDIDILLKEIGDIR